MGNRANFELETVLAHLEKVSQGVAPDSEESGAIELAARALHFISTRDDLAAADVIRIEQEFPGMDEARRWLDSLALPRAGTLVRIAGATHVVARRSINHWIFARTLSPQELNEPPRK